MNHNLQFSPRLYLLFKQAYWEEGTPREQIPDPMQGQQVSLFPRSFVDHIMKLKAKKDLDFNFLGALRSDPETTRNRRWVLEFARSTFTDASHFQATDSESLRLHEKIGPFDKTSDRAGFVPKEVPLKDRAFFDLEYFSILARSKFTLCPAGDAPWSMRFHEAILCRSIPIVECSGHSGRNQEERSLGYHFQVVGDPVFEFDEAKADENFTKFLQRQTLSSSTD